MHYNIISLPSDNFFFLETTITHFSDSKTGSTLHIKTLNSLSVEVA